ncbi:fimbrial protein [Serratia proteamaculans]|uniref:fimbrial protein n=1 Tax=Serratia proteamaculans TaxID=28151 RepID=UPI00217B9AD8|nr:fimbrial protein [Serratia proteamaculans]CAI1822381.1 putative fimbrial subunit SteE [Serratia proteamaculans]CAI2410699.1 putative fimbrial subunit SteE [Serratia proteamaculans]
MVLKNNYDLFAFAYITVIRMVKWVGSILFILACAWSSESLAFHCRLNGVLSGGNERIDINIGPELNDGKNTFVDLSTQIKCWNDGGFIDSLYSDPGKVKLNGSIFPGVLGGITINGADYDIPVSEVHIRNFDPIWDPGEKYAKPLPMKMYFRLNKQLGKQIKIKAGDFIGSLGFIMRNNVGSVYYYSWDVYSKNDVNINTSICSITTGEPINVNFGQVERSEIPTTGGTEQTKAFTLSCVGSEAHDFSVKLNMTPTSWSTSQLVTSNPDLGVQVTVGGTAVKLGSTFAMKVPGAASKTLGFSVLRNPASKALDIATGDFSASGTLVVSEL